MLSSFGKLFGKTSRLSIAIAGLLLCRSESILRIVVDKTRSLRVLGSFAILNIPGICQKTLNRWVGRIDTTDTDSHDLLDERIEELPCPEVGILSIDEHPQECSQPNCSLSK
jgi:hypothetical protein